MNDTVGLRTLTQPSIPPGRRASCAPLVIHERYTRVWGR